MNEYDACEQAFKRGYERGVKEFAERVEKYNHFATWYFNIGKERSIFF